MLHTVFQTAWILILAAFSGNKSLKRQAGFAGACFLAAIGCAYGTAWMSQPVYADILNYPPLWVSWTISAFIGWVMMTGTTIVASYLMESLLGVPHLINGRVVGVSMVIILTVGIWDVSKNLEGADAHVQESFQTVTYEQETQGQDKPYSDEIKKIDESIDGHKVIYKGKLTVRWDARDQVAELEKQRARYVEMQMAAIEAAKDKHDIENAQTENRKENAGKGLKWFSLALYILQLAFNMVVSQFVISWDMRDGERDGKIDYSEQEEDNYYSDKGQREEAIEMESNGTPSWYNGTAIGYKKSTNERNSERSESVRNPREKGTVKDGQSTHERIVMKGGQDTSHPKFSSRVQPDKYRGLNPTKYKKVVTVARSVLDTQGKYNKEQIAREANVSKNTVYKYLKAAITNNDLPA